MFTLWTQDFILSLGEDEIWLSQGTESLWCDIKEDKNVIEPEKSPADQWFTDNSVSAESWIPWRRLNSFTWILISINYWKVMAMYITLYYLFRSFPLGWNSNTPNKTLTLILCKTSHPAPYFSLVMYGSNRKVITSIWNRVTHQVHGSQENKTDEALSRPKVWQEC